MRAAAGDGFSVPALPDSRPPSWTCQTNRSGLHTADEENLLVITAQFPIAR